jgi:hypothetical protein
MKISDYKKGLEVITPMNRPAKAMKMVGGSALDPFTRIVLQYTDVKQDDWMNAHLVSLQPNLIRIA